LFLCRELLKKQLIMKKSLLLLFYGLVLSTTTTAKNIYVQTLGVGEQVPFSILDKPKITFENRAMIVNEVQFHLSDVQNLSFVRNSLTIIPDIDIVRASLYPNPVKEELTLIVHIPIEGMVYQIFDLTGNQIKTGFIRSETTQIDMRSFRAGTYILTILQNGQFLQSFKIIKQ